jgi:simple sugar transport system permease protein
VLNRPELGVLAAAVIIFTAFAVVPGKQGFLSAQRTVNYLEVAAQLSIVATAVALLMIAGDSPAARNVGVPVAVELDLIAKRDAGPVDHLEHQVAQDLGREDKP